MCALNLCLLSIIMARYVMFIFCRIVVLVRHFVFPLDLWFPTGYHHQSKMMMITRRRPKMKREYKIYLTNTIMRQEETINYLCIIMDGRLNFIAHIDYTTGKFIKLLHALSKTAKVNWGLRHDALRMIYLGAILPILSYGVQVCVDSRQRNSNASKLRII
jgi:hypothetical protein